MMKSPLIVTQEKSISSLCLNRPEVHNTLDAPLIKALSLALQEAKTDPNCRLVLLEATGQSFCAGADLHVMQKTIEYSEENNLKDAQQLAHLMRDLFDFPKPTLALVQGSAYGGGIGLIACCDIALSNTSSLFRFSEVALGLAPAVISPYVQMAIGARQMHRYFLSTETFTAERAVAMGLIHELVEDSQLKLDGRKLAEKIAKLPPNAIASTKNLLRELQGHTIDDELMVKTTKTIAKLRISKEAQQCMRAFLSKYSH